jgi:CBS domain-containing protein
MVNRWASEALSGSRDGYEALQGGLTVNLISTPVAELKTCTADEPISEVIEQNPHEFDFLPVLDDKNRFVGMFHAAEHRDRRTLGTVWRCYTPLSEEYLIGADASILDFIVDADQRPCRLVISGSKIIGLVSLSDLQKLPVRAALFALITGLEIAMAERIRLVYPAETDWLNLLEDIRQRKIEEEKSKAKAEDGYVDSLLFTQFCDKREILKHQIPEEEQDGFVESLIRIEALRNSIAHANEYASSPTQAKAACEVIRELLRMRGKLQRDN